MNLIVLFVLRIIVVAILVCSCFGVSAQKYANHWYFGNQLEFDFTSGQAVLGSSNPGNSNEASISISDNNGDLLFYFTKDSLFNKNHQGMPNGDNISVIGVGVEQFFAINHPDSAHKYYLFTPSHENLGPNPLRYTVIDMTKDGGLGEVVVKNVIASDGWGAAMVTGVRHANGKDVWIMSGKGPNGGFNIPGDDSLVCILLTDTGISAPTIHPMPTQLAHAPNNQMKFSPQGDYFTCGYWEAGPTGGTLLYEFDNANGNLGNPIFIPKVLNDPSGREFSCDGRKLYLASTPYLLQYDVSVFSEPAILASETTIAIVQTTGNSMQLGPDKKIHFIENNDTVTGVINEPNLPGTACNFNPVNVFLNVPQFTLNFGYPAFEPSCLCGPQIILDSICEGDTAHIRLLCNYPVDSIVWDFGDTASGAMNVDTGAVTSHVFSGSGLYSVRVIRHQFGVADTVERILVVSPVPTATLGPDTLICSWDSLTLDPGITLVNYLWSDSTTDSSFVVYPMDTIWVSISNGCGFASDTLATDTVLNFSLDFGPDSILCPGDSILLGGFQVGGSYLWQDNSTDSNFLVQTEGIYALTVDNGCYLHADTITIDSLPIPLVQLGNDTLLCEGDTILVQGNTSQVSYLWQDGSTLSNFQVLQTGTFWVEVSNSCGIDSDTIVVDSLIPALVHLPLDSTLCAGDSLLLDASVMLGTYLWQNNATSPQITATQTGTYWAMASNLCGVSTDTVALVFLGNPQPDLGPDTTACIGDSFLLGTSMGYSSVLWQDNSSDSTFLVDSAGLYSVTVSNSCFSAEDSIQVDYISVPSFDLGSDTFLCQGFSMGLIAAVEQATFFWHNGSVDSTIVVAQGGQKWVTANNHCGNFSDTILIEDILFPLVALPGDTSICDNDSAVLDASFSGAWFLWQNQLTDSIQVVKDSGLFWVSVQNECGLATDTLEIALHDSVLFNLGVDTLLCEGDSLSLSAFLSAQYTHFWQDSATSNAYLVLASGKYWAVVSNVCGESSDTVVVGFTETPQLDLGVDLILCQGDSIKLNAVYAHASYQWSSGDTLAELWVKTENTYKVTTTNLCGEASDSVHIGFDTPLVVDLGPDHWGCVGVAQRLQPAPQDGGTYLWSSGATSGSIQIENLGTYWLQITNACGAVADSVFYQTLMAPSIAVSADTAICQGDSAWIRAFSENDTLLWSTGATDPAIWVKQSGNYEIVSFNFCGTARDTVRVLVEALPAPSLGSDLEICPGAWLELKPEPQSLNYRWQDGSTGASFALSTPGMYWVEGSSEIGCLGKDTLVVRPCPVIWVPTAFSPDGDGLNDMFKVEGENFQKFRIQLFNRFGELLFNSIDPDLGWNGQYRGQLVPQGVYSWRLEFVNHQGIEEVRSGQVTLIR